jgi:antirestriction protein ArdC
MSDLNVSWQNILRDAITRPGTIHEAYSRFHNYSIGNQLLALFQCSARGLQPGPIATFMRWKELGRYVRKGEKALTLCMPVTCKAKHSTRDEKGQEAEQEIAFTRFVYRNNWFVVAQTEGAEFKPEPLPDWDETRALAALAIERIPFDDLDGNTQGFVSASLKRTHSCRFCS